MADDTPMSDPTSTPAPIESDDPEREMDNARKNPKASTCCPPRFSPPCGRCPPASVTSRHLRRAAGHSPSFHTSGKATGAYLCRCFSPSRNRTRLAILKTHHIELVIAAALSALSLSRYLAAHMPYIAPYLAAPTYSCRGVIHGVAPDATPEKLLRDLYCYQATILLARRMGNKNYALITFSSMHVPFSVYYQRLEFRCPPQICAVRKQRNEACTNAAKKQRLQHRQQRKSLNTSQPPVKPSNPSSISEAGASSNLLPTHTQWGLGGPHLTQKSPTSVIQPAPSAQPKPAAVRQALPLQKPVQQVRSATTPKPAPTTNHCPCCVDQL
ncbi:hypothetical protein HPB49_020713 [Dermacentor silvarum]|uniref:Uncharacterized protein n=1 Tax=Dermacentor silvarum TaxID=543639 RepID=A0ACB8DFN1_DERSI|nr:hypothetical protein HPB49_020713 [Dermacentor silvarum]